MRKKFELNEKTMFKILSVKKRVVDRELSNIIDQQIKNLEFAMPIKYFFSAGGKRLRPIMLILSAQSVGGRQSSVLQLAIAIELIHNASLIIDDIIDEEEERRGSMPLHKKYSNKEAVIIASTLSALAIKLATKYGVEVTKFLSEIALRLCEGEYLDYNKSSQYLTEDDVLLIIKNKTAALFEASTFLGALAGGGSSYEVKALREYGFNFGMAYQLLDDLADLKNHRKIAHNSMIELRPILPLIFFIRHYDNERIINKLTSKNITFDEYNYILKMMEENGSMKYCEHRIKDFIDEAIRSLYPIKNSKYKELLVSLAQYLPMLISK